MGQRRLGGVIDGRKLSFIWPADSRSEVGLPKDRTVVSLSTYWEGDLVNEDDAKFASLRRSEGCPNRSISEVGSDFVDLLAENNRFGAGGRSADWGISASLLFPAVCDLCLFRPNVTDTVSISSSELDISIISTLEGGTGFIVVNFFFIRGAWVVGGNGVDEERKN